MRVARPIHVGFVLLFAVVLGAGVGFISWAAGLTPWPGLAIGAVTLVFGLRRPARRWRVARRTLPSDWREWLEEAVPFYEGLGAPDRERFELDVRFIMSEWTFEAVQDASADERHQLSVAAGVAMLLHGRPDWEISPPRTILFYSEQFDEQYFTDSAGNYDGMAHAQGPVILSVPAVEATWRNGRRGSNVVLHELAHLLDFANDFADGVSSLIDPSSIAAWNELVRREMHRIRFGRSILRKYAAKNRAEFFAVAIENFYGRPEVLAHHHSELYEALVALLNLDPREVLRKDE